MPSRCRILFSASGTPHRAEQRPAPPVESRALRNGLDAPCVCSLVAASGRQRASRSAYDEAMPSTAEKTFFEAIYRTCEGQPAKATIYERLHGLLDPGETVFAIADGYADYMSDHLLLLTDRRVMLVRSAIPGRWKVLRDVPASAVTGVGRKSGALTSAALEVTVQGQKPVSIKIGRDHAASELERTLNGLLRQEQG